MRIAVIITVTYSNSIITVHMITMRMIAIVILLMMNI